MEFDHVGIPARAKREGMRYLESKQLWLTSPSDHPYRVEWLWYEEGSPEAELVRTLPHVAYRVDSLDEAMAGQRLDAASKPLGPRKRPRARPAQWGR